MNFIHRLKSYSKKNRITRCPEWLLSVLNEKGVGNKNECFVNAMVAVNRFDDVDKYILGWCYFTSKVEKSPVEHAWIKIGNEYHDPTIIPENQKRQFRYTPVFELDNEEVKKIIYSKHTEEECELIKKGEFPFDPPNIQDVKNYRNA